MNEDSRARGQALVLFALLLTVLIGMAALAIDIAGAYAEIRHERSAADSAALAGASDNFRVGSTTVDNTEWTRARTHAMQNLIDELDPSFVAGSALPICAGQGAPYSGNVVNCQIPGTRYYVSILAPAPSCTPGACDSLRSVQVTVRTPKHGLTFARLFGQAQWNLPVTSVAERDRGTNYSFVTLRPPKPRSNGTDANEDDIGLDGSGTVLSVRGDMGTNSNMVLTNGSTVLLLDAGSFVDRYDTYQAWTGPPPSNQISQPIADPNYPIPAAPSNPALIYANAAAAHMTAPPCKVEVAKVRVNYGSLPVPVNDAGVDNGIVVCLKPGLYTYAPGTGSDYSSVKTMIFTPGVYFFDRGLKPGNNSQVIGGYEAAMPGVAFVFKPQCNPGCELTGNTLDVLALNAGAAYPSGTGVSATAAVNWDGTFVQTTGPIPLPMTLIVRKNPACVVAIIDPCNVNVSQYRQLTLPGGSSTFVFGVQYAATDNIFITGGSAGNGFLGQIWAWTVKYSGGTRINLVGAQNNEPGVLRIATPCSPGAPCTNPEAAAPIP